MGSCYVRLWFLIHQDSKQQQSIKNAPSRKQGWRSKRCLCKRTLKTFGRASEWQISPYGTRGRIFTCCNLSKISKIPVNRDALPKVNLKTPSIRLAWESPHISYCCWQVFKNVLLSNPAASSQTVDRTWMDPPFQALNWERLFMEYCMQKRIWIMQDFKENQIKENPNRYLCIKM